MTEVVSLYCTILLSPAQGWELPRWNRVMCSGPDKMNDQPYMRYFTTTYQHLCKSQGTNHISPVWSQVLWPRHYWCNTAFSVNRSDLRVCLINADEMQGISQPIHILKWGLSCFMVGMCWPWQRRRRRIASRKCLGCTGPDSPCVSMTSNAEKK